MVAETYWSRRVFDPDLWPAKLGQKGLSYQHCLYACFPESGCIYLKSYCNLED